MIDISIDLETLSSDPRGASLATIGLAAQDFETGQIWTGYWVTNDPTGIIEPETVRWHIAQGAPASAIGIEHVVPIGTALEQLGALLKMEFKAHREGTCRIWTHATFDIPQLAIAYKRLGMKHTWFYRNCRDLRTLYDLAGGRPHVENHNPHNALADAVAQLEEVRLCLEILERRSNPQLEIL